MFARTERLLLRPAWPEDAGALALALADARVARMLARIPHPYTLDDAVARTLEPRAADEPRFLIDSLEGGTPTLIGGIGIADRDGEGLQFHYWLTPTAWGCGYATEAGRAVIAMARHALPIDRLGAWHFADNPASGRVLRKLGFRPTGSIMQRPSLGRGDTADSVEYELDLGDRPELQIAA
jgi:RimJ/RimL family protein N-acetyltransferase